MRGLKAPAELAERLAGRRGREATLNRESPNPADGLRIAQRMENTTSRSVIRLRSLELGLSIR